VNVDEIRGCGRSQGRQRRVGHWNDLHVRESDQTPVKWPVAPHDATVGDRLSEREHQLQRLTLASAKVLA
jgi:hypothetical protein